MFMSQLLTQTKARLPVAFRRNIGVASVAFQSVSDPIQQLFLDKVREYRSKSDGGKKLVDPTPDVQKELKSELHRLTVQYGGQPGEDMTKFPEFKFEDAHIDPVTDSSAN